MYNTLSNKQHYKKTFGNALSIGKSSPTPESAKSQMVEKGGESSGGIIKSGSVEDNEYREAGYYQMQCTKT